MLFLSAHPPTLHVEDSYSCLGIFTTFSSLFSPNYRKKKHQSLDQPHSSLPNLPFFLQVAREIVEIEA